MVHERRDERTAATVRESHDSDLYDVVGILRPCINLGIKGQATQHKASGADQAGLDEFPPCLHK